MRGGSGRSPVASAPAALRLEDQLVADRLRPAPGEVARRCVPGDRRAQRPRQAPAQQPRARPARRDDLLQGAEPVLADVDGPVAEVDGVIRLPGEPLGVKAAPRPPYGAHRPSPFTMPSISSRASRQSRAALTSAKTSGGLVSSRRTRARGGPAQAARAPIPAPGRPRRARQGRGRACWRGGRPTATARWGRLCPPRSGSRRARPPRRSGGRPARRSRGHRRGGDDHAGVDGDELADHHGHVRPGQVTGGVGVEVAGQVVALGLWLDMAARGRAAQRAGAGAGRLRLGDGARISISGTPSGSMRLGDRGAAGVTAPAAPLYQVLSVPCGAQMPESISIVTASARVRSSSVWSAFIRSASSRSSASSSASTCSASSCARTWPSRWSRQSATSAHASWCLCSWRSQHGASGCPLRPQ